MQEARQTANRSHLAHEVASAPSLPASHDTTMYSQRLGSVSGFLRGFIRHFNRRFSEQVDSRIPREFESDAELVRRGRLVTRFGALGSIFGITYAAFYLLIGHRVGASIIVVCTASVAVMPILMYWTKSVDVAGNFLALILTLGFSGLCYLEGGLHGHAIAWLVSVPLCALLLVGERAGGRWMVISFSAASIFAGLALGGVRLAPGYAPVWNSVVSAAGYLGLVLFMFILGIVFETGRAEAARKMEETLSKLAASNERLVYLNKEKNEFMGIAAHDLKNPLMAIAGSAQMVLESRDPRQIYKLAANIESAAVRMGELIKNLLDVNAIEQGAFISKVERSDFNSLVQASVRNNQEAAERKEIGIRFGMSEGLWAKVDPNATLQILDNLISNALKYSPPKSTVHVHTLPETAYVLVTIRDEGPGISEADQKKLFQKFSRLSAQPTGGESSTGLGLAIVKRLAEAMSGSIQCHSVLGAGTTFTLRLPVWPEGEVPSASPPASDIPIRTVSSRGVSALRQRN